MHRLVRASAGTGKTYQLVQTYVRLITEKNLRPSQIVAITFTKKAAAELRVRILDELKNLAIDADILAELHVAPISNFHGLALKLLKDLNPYQPFSILSEEHTAEHLFLQACQTAWFNGDAEVSTALQAVSRYFNVDEQLPYDLWQAFNLAREDGQYLTGVTQAARLLGTYDFRSTAKEQHQQLLALRADLQQQLSQVKNKALERLREFLAFPVPALYSEEWATEWARIGNCLDLRTDLKKIITKEQKELFTDNVFTVEAERCCEQLVTPLALLIDQATQTYKSLKQQKSLLDFADLVENAVTLLEHQPELKENFSAVLVDEAQDTNALQRRFIHLLCSEQTSLFVVGDRKQAIYTFRGADPLSFERFAQDILDREGSSETLHISRRSTAKIVACINSLGERLFAEYEALEALPTDVPSTVDWVQTDNNSFAEAEAVAAYIHSQLLVGKKPNDFAILLPAMTDAPLFLKALQNLDIQGVTALSNGFYHQPEVIDVLALMTALTDTSDTLSLAIALNSPLIGLSDEALLYLFQQPNLIQKLQMGDTTLTLFNAADQTILEQLLKRWPKWYEAASVLGPQDLLRQLVFDTEAYAVYAQFEQANQRHLHLDKLNQLAGVYQRQGMSAAHFSWQMLQRHHEEVSEPLAVEQTQDAVTLCSVHQSKGLQFNTVLLASLHKKDRHDFSVIQYTSEEGFIFKPSLELGKSQRLQHAQQKALEKQRAEKARLLYVAMTRAEQHLIFFGDANKKSSEGFAQFLMPWLSQALDQKILSFLEITKNPPLKNHAPNKIEAIKVTPEIIADQEHVFSVTQLQHYLQCLRRGQLLHQWQIPQEISTKQQKNIFNASLRGQLGHAILASIDGLTPNKSLEEFIEEKILQHGYDPQELKTLQQEITAFLTSDLGQTILQSAERHYEVPFHLQLLPARILGQIDLVYFDKQKPVIVDYKYTSLKSESSLKTYVYQLEIYALALWKIMGDAILHEGAIRTLLVFLGDRGVSYEYKVTRDMLDSLELKITAITSSLIKTGKAPLNKEALEVCMSLNCNFRARCHPGGGLDDKFHDMATRKLEAFSVGSTTHL